MRFRRHCLVIAAICIMVWAGGLFLLSGCGLAPMRLDPLLVANHDGKEVSDAEVDIQVERPGFLSVQAECIKDEPSAALFMPIMACSTGLECLHKKMWQTDKICTCRIWLWAEWALEEEIAHCRGWLDIFY